MIEPISCEEEDTERIRISIKIFYLKQSILRPFFLANYVKHIQKTIDQGIGSDKMLTHNAEIILNCGTSDSHLFPGLMLTLLPGVRTHSAGLGTQKADSF